MIQLNNKEVRNMTKPWDKTDCYFFCGNKCKPIEEVTDEDIAKCPHPYSSLHLFTKGESIIKSL